MASDWVKTTLGEIVKLGNGIIQTGPFGSQLHASDYVDEGIPVIMPLNIINNKIDLSGIARITKEDAERLSKHLVKKNDIVYSRRGDVTRKALITELEEGMFCGTGCLLVRPGNSIDARFLTYHLSSPINQEWIIRHAVGATMPNLNTGILKRVPLNIPSLDTQKAIAHILGSLDDKIELNRQMNERLEAMAQALFKSWFVDFDPVINNALAAGKPIPDEFIERSDQRKAIKKKDNSDIQALFPDEFEFTEEMGWIPKGWAVSNVGTEFDVTMGQSPPGSTYNELKEGIYFFQGSTDFGFRYPTPRIYCTEPKRLANKRDTLVSVRAPVGDTNLAAVDCCIGRGLAALRHKSGSASFTYYAMLQLKENFKIYEGEGTVFGSINQKDFKNLIQLKLPEILISEFEVNAGALDSKIELNSLNIITLAKLRDTLLPKLMSGELRIADAAAMVEDV